MHGHEGRIGKSAAAAAKGRKLAEELLVWHLEHAEILKERDAIKASLIELATEAGEGMHEVFVDRGQVTVSGAKAREFKGHFPEVDERALENLSEVKRQRLIDAGIIKIVARYAAAYHGRCTVKTF